MKTPIDFYFLYALTLATVVNVNAICNLNKFFKFFISGLAFQTNHLPSDLPRKKKNQQKNLCI